MEPTQSDFTHKKHPVYSVQELNQAVKQLLLQTFPLLWVEGELSNISRPASGHMYFSLKDEHAQVRSVMFQNANSHLAFQAKEGMSVLVKARVGLYEPRGEYQLIVEHMEEAGIGVLQRRFEALKRKLDEEGLFSSKHKQTLPPFPASLCIITSATGAALRDILSVLGRRFPLLKIQIYATPVQGDACADAVVEAIRAINQNREGELIILARGGGSIEDLWAFNEESVARAIFASKLPIVTGIGHEVDFTIADFVADLRAPTPSAAAEMVVPHAGSVLESLEHSGDTLNRLVNTTVGNLHQTVDWLAKRLDQLHPNLTVQNNRQFLIELQRRLLSGASHQISDHDKRFVSLLIRFEKLSPKAYVDESRITLSYLYWQLENLLSKRIEQLQYQLEKQVCALDTASPLATLNRGYSIVTLKKDGKILRDTKQAYTDDAIIIRLARGRLNAHID